MALLAQPGIVQRLIDAAHRGPNIDQACEEVRKECELLREELGATASYFAPTSGGDRNKTALTSALQALSQPGSPGMRWLLGQRPSA
jgi:hypothetical protein